MVKIILVNEEDQEIGLKEKMQAHIDGNLHRALSIQLYNSKGEIFIHKRASSKYHCGGLWTNACCSHPHPGELTIDGATRRLYEELGYKRFTTMEGNSFGRMKIEAYTKNSNYLDGYPTFCGRNCHDGDWDHTNNLAVPKGQLWPKAWFSPIKE